MCLRQQDGTDVDDDEVLQELSIDAPLLIILKSNMPQPPVTFACDVQELVQKGHTEAFEMNEISCGQVGDDAPSTSTVSLKKTGLSK